MLQRVLNPDPIKDEAKENRLTLFKAHTQNMTPYPREKQKLRIAWMVQLYFMSVTMEGYE